MLRVLPSRWEPGAIVVIAIGILALVTGCGEDSPQAPNLYNVMETVPSPTTPQNLARTVEWAWNHRNTGLYGSLFTSDFRFEFAWTDSTRVFYPNGLTREDELRFARNFFVTGTSSRPPPTAISLKFSDPIVPGPDHRPGKDPRFHVEVGLPTLLRVDNPNFEVTGTMRLYLVRGDSAAWPNDVPHVAPDSSRWWVERWDDESLGGPSPVPSFHTQPASSHTMGEIKRMYLDDAAPTLRP